MDNVRRKKTIFLVVFLIVLIVGSGSASSNFSISPAKLTISVSEDFPNKPIYYPVQINNNEQYDVNFTVDIINPDPIQRTSGCTNIPDLSWVKVNQSVVNVKAGESKLVDICLDVPDSKKQMSYNKNWEVWIKVCGGNDEGPGNSIKIALALKLLIDTPKKEQIKDSSYFIFFFFSLIIIVTIIYIFTRRTTILKFTKKHGIFYFKKK